MVAFFVAAATYVLHSATDFLLSIFIVADILDMNVYRILLIGVSILTGIFYVVALVLGIIAVRSQMSRLMSGFAIGIAGVGLVSDIALGIGAFF